MVDNLLPEHVELLHVLDLAVHLVQLMTWMGRGGHTETLCDYSVTPSPIGLWIFYFFGFWIGIESRGTGFGTRA